MNEAFFERLLRAAILVAALGTGLIVIGSRYASAADLGYKDQPSYSAPVAGVSWSGLYINGGLGYSAGRATLSGDLSIPPNSLGASTDTSVTGFVGVVGLGADWHFPASRWVMGVYGDYAIGDRDGDILGVTLNSSEYAIKAKMSNQWAAGGRLGFLVTPGALAYAKLGYTQADEELSLSAPGSSSPAWKETKGGYAVGGGLEASMGSNFFIRGEYMYSDYGSATLVDESLLGANLKVKEDFSDSRFTAQLIYKLGWSH